MNLLVQNTYVKTGSCLETHHMGSRWKWGGSAGCMLTAIAYPIAVKKHNINQAECDYTENCIKIWIGHLVTQKLTA